MIEKESFLQLSIREQIKTIHSWLLKDPYLLDYTLDDIDSNKHPIKFVFDLIYEEPYESLDNFMKYLDSIRKDLYYGINVEKHTEFLQAVFPICRHGDTYNTFSDEQNNALDKMYLEIEKDPSSPPNTYLPFPKSTCRYCDGRLGDEGGLVCKRYVHPTNKYLYTGQDNNACVDNYVLPGSEYKEYENNISLYDLLRLFNNWQGFSSPLFQHFDKPIDLITFVSRLASSFNVISDIKKAARCEECHYSLSITSNDFFWNSDIEYECSNVLCGQFLKKVTFNRCLARGCGAFIDSRKSKIHPTSNDYHKSYMCLKCGSSKHYRAGEYCPKCGSHNMNKLYRKFTCKDCNHFIHPPRNNDLKPVHDPMHMFLSNAIIMDEN